MSYIITQFCKAKIQSVLVDETDQFKDILKIFEKWENIKKKKTKQIDDSLKAYERGYIDFAD